MRIFKYLEPADPDSGNWEPREVTVTSEEIAEDYWPWWSERMLSLGRTPTLEDCIQDFLTIHWAEEA